MKFSPSTGGWYPEFIDYPQLPADLVTVPDELYRSLVSKRIEAGPDGMPREWTPPAADARAALLAAVSDKRRALESAGIVVDGLTIATGREDQARLVAVLATADAAGVGEIEFKAASGWAHLTLAQVQDIAGAVGRHVQACFAAERAHHDAIAALADDALAGYSINDGWPAAAGGQQGA